MSKQEYSIGLSKLLKDLKQRPSTIRNRWKELSSEEREIFFDAVEALSNKNQAIIREMVNKS